MAKRKRSRSKRSTASREVSEMSSDVRAGKAKLDREMAKAGINWKKLVGAIITIIGIVFVLLNLVGIIYAFVGLVLIYFGIKMLGYNIHKALQ